MTEAMQLEGYICEKCEWSDVFKVQTCPLCHGPTKHTIFPDVGQVASFTVVRYPPQGFEKESPYTVAIIDVKDGPRLMARVLGPGEGLRVGQTVRFAGSKNGALEFKA